MRQKLALLIFLLVNAMNYNGYSQSPPVFDWQHCIGGSSYDAATKVFLADDGGYVLVGTTNSNNGNVSGNHGASDVWVVKLDAGGTFQWQKCLGGNKVDAAVSALQLPGGNIIVLSTANSNNGNVTNNHGGNTNTSDIWLCSLDPSGSLLWQKTFGGSSYDEAHALLKTSDNNLLIGGSTESNNGDVTGNHGGKDFWLIKIDTLGNLLWQKALGGSGSDICNEITETGNGYVAVGSSTSSNFDVTHNYGGNDFWVVQTDFSGNLIWEKSFGGTSNESAFSTLVNTAGNIMVGGYTTSNDSDVMENHGGSEYWLLELDPAGNKVMQSTFGGSNSDLAFSIVKADADGYLLAGGTTSNDFDLQMGQFHGGEDCWLMKTNLAGNLIWSRTYGGSNSDRAYSVLQTPDGGYVIAGYTQSNNGQVSGNHGANDMWVAKLSCLAPVAAFTTNDDTICVGALMNFTNNSIQSADYTWMADGVPFNFSSDASIQFTSAGTYEISLAGSTCYASDTTRHTLVAVNPPSPVVTQDGPYVCSGHSINLETQYAQSYLWLPDSIITPTLEITHGGDYAVQVSYHQCVSTSPVLTVAEHVSPVVDLGIDTSFCQTTSYKLHAPSGYQSYLWQNGSTDTVLYANAAGTYYVSVSSAFCSTTDSINLSVVHCDLAVASFTASQTNICENSCISFTDLSAFAQSWSWSFPGANVTSSTDQNPTNICYSTPGTYEVDLTVTNQYGSNAFTFMNYITVNADPASPSVIANGFWLSSSVTAAGYQWYLNGDIIPGATLQFYSASSDGYYSVMIDNGSGCTSTSQGYYLNVTNVAVQNFENAIQVYPNPARDMFTISGLSDALKIEVSDIAGKIVYSEQIISPKKEISISTENFDNGIYFLKITSADKVAGNKIVINH
jgi:PKD repeat protein